MLTGGEDDDLPEWAATAFWALVVVFNVAVFFTAVGALVLYFEGDVMLSMALFTIGALAWAVGLGGYGLTRRRLRA